MIDEEKDFELLERRLRERIEANVRGSLFKAYGIAGAAVLAVLGFTGYNLLSEVSDHANRSVELTIEKRTKMLDDYVVKKREQLDDLTGKVKSDLDKSAVLSDLVTNNIARLRSQTDSLSPIVSDLRENSDVAKKSLDSLRSKSEEFSASLENARYQTLNALTDNARMAKFPDELDTLNKRVEELAQAIAKLAVSSSQPATNAVVAETANRVAATSVTASYAIAKEQSRTVLFIQYNAIPPNTANAIANRLRADGLIVPGIDSEPMNDTRFRVVRYYNSQDETEAQRVAGLTARAIAEVGLPSGNIRVEDYTSWKGAKLKPGTIELWLGEPKGS